MGKTGCASLTGDIVSKVEKRLDNSASKPFVVRDGQHDGDVTIKIADQDWRSLGLVEHGFKTPPRLLGADSLHGFFTLRDAASAT